MSGSPSEPRAPGGPGATAEPVAPGGPRTPAAPDSPETSPSRWARLAHRGLRSGLALRAALSLVGAAVLLACGILMADHGIVDHVFPPYVAGQQHTVITSYSGPWLTGAIAVGAVAGLLLVFAVTDLWRRRLIGRDLRTSAAPVPD